MLVLLCWLVSDVCFLQVSCTFCQSCFQKCWKDVCQSYPSTWQFIKPSLDIHEVIAEIEHVCQKHICAALLVAVKLTIQHFFSKVSCTFHQSCPRNVLEVNQIHINSLANHIEMPKVIPETQHICNEHVSFALLVAVGCVGFLQFSCTFGQSCFQKCWKVVCQSCLSTWQFIIQSLRHT